MHFIFANIDLTLKQIFAGAFPKNYEPPPGGFYYEITDDSPVVQVFSLAVDYYFLLYLLCSYDKVGSLIREG